MSQEADTAGLRRLWVLVRHLPPEAALWEVRRVEADKAHTVDDLSAFFGRTA